MSRHAPCASFPAFSDHDRELVQSVGFQTRHHVTQVGRVGRLKTSPRDELRCQRGKTNSAVLSSLYLKANN